jgi:hypothetical protein
MIKEKEVLENYNTITDKIINHFFNILEKGNINEEALSIILKFKNEKDVFDSIDINDEEIYKDVNALHTAYHTPNVWMLVNKIGVDVTFGLTQKIQSKISQNLKERKSGKEETYDHTKSEISSLDYVRSYKK